MLLLLHCVLFSVERLFHELVASGRDALYPVTLTQNGMLGLAPEVISSSKQLFILLKYYGYVWHIKFQIIFDIKILTL